MTPEVAAQVTLAKDVVLMLAAVVGASVGVIGLWTWRRQISGKSRHDAAASLLAATYRMRSAIQAVRSRRFGPDELPVFHLVVSDRDLPKAKDRELLLAAYQRRWQRLESALSDFDRVRHEAVVALGDDLLGLCAQMDNCYYYLSHAAHHYFKWIENADLHGSIPDQFRSDIESRMGLVGDGEDDDYGQMLRRVVQRFENRLAPVIKAAR